MSITDKPSRRETIMGGKPSKGTPADKRLKANKTSAPKFGSPAWDKKYQTKKK